MTSRCTKAGADSADVSEYVDEFDVVELIDEVEGLSEADGQAGDTPAGDPFEGPTDEPLHGGLDTDGDMVPWNGDATPLESDVASARSVHAADIENDSSGPDVGGVKRRGP